MIPIFSIFRRKIRKTPESAGKIRFLFSRFQTILDMNTRILEKMIEMERMLGGEYIFDRTFLENSVSEIGPLVYQVVYSLNAMTDNRFAGLFDTFQDIRGYLDDILAGGLGPYAERLTLSYPSIRMEMQGLVGTSSSNLAELGHHTGIHTPDGFAVTTTGLALFMNQNDLYARIGRIVSGDWTLEKEEEIGRLVAEAPVPADLEKAVTVEMGKLAGRFGDLRRVWVSAEAVKPETSGRGSQPIKTELSGIWDAVKKSIALCLCEAAVCQPEGLEGGEFPMAVSVQAQPRPMLWGSVLTMDPLYGSRQVARVTVSGEDGPDSFLVYRFYPFDPVESVLTAKGPGDILPDRKKSTSMMPGGLRRGSALIRKNSLITLVETAMTVERTFGKPQNLSWIEDASGRITITGIEPVSAINPDEISMEALNDQLMNATVLLQGGETAQMGVAVGRVVHVRGNVVPDDFPQGAVAVARTASPDLSPLLRRASGLVTETGSPIGHLAAIAREVRIPCIMGLSNALEVLGEGAVVTVDAGECRVYQGVLELLARYRSSGVELYPTDPEYIILRQLLRWIIPLDLNDPDSQEFTMENCRTFHDIIHFAHEMAVEELLNIQTRHRDLKGVSTRRLALDIPMDIRVLMIEDGLTGSGQAEWRLGDISSFPFLAYLRGLTQNGLWDQRPAAIGLKDIFSGMDRTYAALTNRPEYSGQNLAIVAENYLNLTLRMGYHFNVINAYVSDNPNKNFIYFRFVGGFAYAERRKRRAEFIAAVLAAMDFKVTVTGDLVVGKLRMAGRKQMEWSLLRLGQLTAFTRQLDIRMGFDGDVETFVKDFDERAGSENG